jgi:hypothetical protein
MTVYTGRTFQTCALRVWGIWVSMRDFQAAGVRLKPLLQKESPTPLARGAIKWH